MRAVHLILTLLLCLGTAVSAQEGSDTKTSSKKKPSTTSGSAGSSTTGSSTKKKTTSSGTASTASSASKAKPKSTATSGSKTKTNTTTPSEETPAKKEAMPKENEETTSKESGTASNEKNGASSKTESSEKKEASKDTATATTKTKPKANSSDESATSTTSPSKKPTVTDSDKPTEGEDGADERDPKKAGKKPAAVSSIAAEEIEGFDTYPPATQQIIRRSLELTTQNLRYQFGSADPKAGGMDCSGTMYRVLQDSGIKDVPRQSDEICRWVMRHTQLYRTEDTSTLKDKSLSALKPGDLLFWTGTYETSSPRELPISHVMLYLGKRKKDGKPVVFGASDGRTYDGQRRNGVSVFDFVMPKRDGKAAFYGYGSIPGMTGSIKTASSAAGQ